MTETDSRAEIGRKSMRTKDLTEQARSKHIMRFYLIAAVALLGVLHLAAIDGSAAPLTWTLQGVTFADGAKASGSFIFDATTDIYSGIDMVTIGGTLPSNDATFIALFPLLTSSATALFTVPNAALSDFTGSAVLLMTFASALTNAGGTIGILPGVPMGVLSGVGTCGNANCTTSTSPADLITSGSVTTNTVATPEPSTFVLLFVSLLVLAAVFKRYRIAREFSGPVV